MAKRRGTVRAYEAAFGKVLMMARAEVLAKLENGKLKAESRNAPRTRAAAADFMFDLGRFTDRLLAEMRRTAGTALNTAGTQLFQEIGKDDPFAMAPAKVLEFVASRENKLSGVADDVFDQVKATRRDGFDQGLATDKIAANIRAQFNGMAKERAKTIAITETAAAYGYGRNDAMVQAGITRKAWLTSGNANVRPTHEAAGEAYGRRQAIPISEPFVVGGARLMFPGDPSGPPQEVINCHCVQIAVAAEGAE
jgi:hypothetical protein